MGQEPRNQMDRPMSWGNWPSRNDGQTRMQTSGPKAWWQPCRRRYRSRLLGLLHFIPNNFIWNNFHCLISSFLCICFSFAYFIPLFLCLHYSDWIFIVSLCSTKFKSYTFYFCSFTFTILYMHHQLSGHEFEQTPGDSEGQGSLACCSPWGHKVSDLTERLNWTGC